MDTPNPKVIPVTSQTLEDEMPNGEIGQSANDIADKVQEDKIRRNDNGTIKVDSKVMEYIPLETAQENGIVPLYIDEEGRLVVGSVKEHSADAIDILNFIASRRGIKYEIVKITENEFEDVIGKYTDTNYGVNSALSDYVEYEDVLPSDVPGLQSLDDGEIVFDSSSDTEGVGGEVSHTIQKDAPITRLVNNILVQAVNMGASDVHMEPKEGNFVVRLRVDGKLRQAFDFPKKIHSVVTAQIKIRSKIRLDERRKPQDGNFSARVGGNRIDFRVVTFPIRDGEKTVLRILRSDSVLVGYDQLGFSQRTVDVLDEAIKRPFGLILASGPTGSGKTTSVYSIIDKLDKVNKNIVSLENPVEYTIEGVGQSEIIPEIGYTFATGLRSIVRADPDIIFVGEIRDKETAQLAIQAALTGHLVLSTIHTNTSMGVIPRLIDMGIDPYLIASTLSAVVAQRLASKFCEGGSEEVKMTDHARETIDSTFSDLPEEFKKKLPPLEHIYSAKQVPTCPTGTKGRTAVTESFLVDKDMVDLIYQKPSQNEVYTYLRTKGFMTLREDAIIKAVSGEIPFAEVAKVASDVSLEDTIVEGSTQKEPKESTIKPNTEKEVEPPLNSA